MEHSTNNDQILFKNKIYNNIIEFSKCSQDQYLIDIDILQLSEYNWCDRQQYIETQILAPRRIYYNMHCSKLSDISLTSPGIIERLYYDIKNNFHTYCSEIMINNVGSGNYHEFKYEIKQNEATIELYVRLHAEYESFESQFLNCEYSYKQNYSELLIPNIQISLRYFDPRNRGYIKYLISYKFANTVFNEMKNCFTII